MILSDGIGYWMLAFYFSPAGFLPVFYLTYLILRKNYSKLRIIFSILFGIISSTVIWFAMGSNIGFIDGLPGQGRIYLCLLVLLISYLLIVWKKLNLVFTLIVSFIAGFISISFLSFILFYFFSTFLSSYIKKQTDYSSTSAPIPPFIIYIIIIEAIIILIQICYSIILAGKHGANKKTVEENRKKLIPPFVVVSIILITVIFTLISIPHFTFL